MTKCVCGNVIEAGRPDVRVYHRTCRCGLPPRKIVFGAPEIAIKPRNKEREAAGLPDKTDLEKYVENPPAWH